MNLLKVIFVSLLLSLFIPVDTIASIQWEYDTKIEVVEEITDLGNGQYHYEYSLENNDNSAIWYFKIYTNFFVEPFSNPSTGFNGYGYLKSPPQSDEIRYLSSHYDARNLDDNIQCVIWTGYEYWHYGEDGGIQPGETATGFSFTADRYDDNAKYYSYSTINSNEGWGFDGVFSAVGQTVIPEPSALLLLSIGCFICRKNFYLDRR